jgi:hypothetical protein
VIPPPSRALGARWLLLAMLQAGPALADALRGEVLAPPESRRQVDLERELQAPWQAGGEIVVFSTPDGAPRAGRLAAPPSDASEERTRRAEHFALARRLNLVSAPRVVPMAQPLDESQIELLERFAMSDAGAVWLREVADDTLRLFNQGYLEVDQAPWLGFLAGGTRPRLSELITGRLSEAGLFAQDAAVFRIFAFDGFGAMAAAASIRMGLRGFRCNFQFGGEPVDPLAVLSHEFGHTRYGDPRSAGLPLGEARTVARYENPVRLRNGFPPRTIYYLRIDPGRPATTRDTLFARVLAWRQERDPRMADLDPVVGLYCECPGSPDTLRDCLARAPAGSSAPDAGDCDLRWVAVRVDSPEPSAGHRP